MSAHRPLPPPLRDLLSALSLCAGSAVLALLVAAGPGIGGGGGDLDHPHTLDRLAAEARSTGSAVAAAPITDSTLRPETD